MKKGILSLFALAILFFTPAPVRAAFVVKKHAVQAASVVGAVSSNNTIAAKNTAAAEVSKMIQQSPAPSFTGMMGRGLIGLIAAICGVLGLFFPIFSIGAILLGFIGLGRRNRNRGMAIAGLVLGILGIILSV